MILCTIRQTQDRRITISILVMRLYYRPCIGSIKIAKCRSPTVKATRIYRRVKELTPCQYQKQIDEINLYNTVL